MSTGPRIGIIAAQEIRRAYNNFWSRLALMFILAYTIVYLGNLYTLAQDRGAASVHTMANFVDFINTLRWGALAVAAVMAGPALMEDYRRGALELYFTRAVTRTEYFSGKIVAILGVSTIALLLPSLVYYASAFFLLEDQPTDWNLIPTGALAYALVWGLLVSGLGLGLSSVAKSSRGATLLLFGGFATLDIFISNIMEQITKNKDLEILSPFAAVEPMTDWFFNVDAGRSFPAWWGLIAWGALVLVGWGLLGWKQPRVRGEEPARA